MRQIKFRIYDKERNIMEEVGAIDWASDGFPITVNTETKKYYRPECGDGHFPIMQFTGLLDKNGKEIYEGDIVRCFDTSGEKVYDRVVDFYGFRNEIWSEEVDGKTKVEIIGNIYEKIYLRMGSSV